MRALRSMCLAGGLALVLALGSVAPGAASPGNSQNGNGHGANQSGPYDPNGVGEPSGNGRSDSNNGNRPCAGCVGNADNKNPPGQLPGGSDPNRGYECDANQGVGKTNPAHSGCGAVSGPPPNGGPPNGGPPNGGPPNGGPSDRPEGGATPGGGGNVPGPPASEVRGVTEQGQARAPAEAGKAVPVSAPAKPAADNAAPEAAGDLPFTGYELLALGALGLLALGVGFGVRRTLTLRSQA
jgi:hypothetical protein